MESWYLNDMADSSAATKVAFVFRSGRGEGVSGYRSEPFRRALGLAGVEPVVIDVIGADESEAPVHPESDNLTCREPEVAGALARSGADLVQTFGAESGLGAVWSAAAGRPLLHFVQAANLPNTRPPRALARALSGLGHRLGASGGAGHVTGVLGASRSVVARYLDAGLFPAATFSRVIAPPIELPAASPAAVASAPGLTFGIYDTYGNAETLRFVIQAITSTGHPDLFRVKLAYPLYQVPPMLPANVSVVSPDNPQDFVDSIDALIMPYDADHLVASLLMAVRAGRTVLVPDGGVASELIGFGRHGVVFAAGSAYDLALKINLITRSIDDRPFEFQGGAELARRCAPDEVARGFAAAIHFALGSGD